MNKMQKIIPHLWFDKEAEEAAKFYIEAFKDFPESKITNITILKDTPSGDAASVSFQIAGFSFMAISAGPFFKINPSVSFMLNFDPSKDSHAKEKLDKLWNILKEGGSELMPLGEYPFSKHYGWTQDKFGVSWQLILTNPKGEERPFIIPSMMFVGKVAGKSEEATDFYMHIFKNSQRGTIARYPTGMAPEKEGTIMFTDFKLENQWFAAMDSANDHKFAFSEAISFLVQCQTQEEIDYYWEKLSAVPESEQCGWLKDKYGFSWQISPTLMNKVMTEGSPEQIERVTQVFLKMKKFDISKLKEAYKGK